MKSYIDNVTVNQDVCNGKPTIRGMRITVKTILEYLAAGESVENILKAYPVLKKEDIFAAFQYYNKINENYFSFE
ncbi:MAG: antitoxin [Bacteroidetes bacterium]|nr:MAG: antitoxin [Bacteroidota bacterium]